MIKIVETYSHKILADVKIETITYQNITDANGLTVSIYSTSALPEFKARTSPHKSSNDRELVILRGKMNVVDCKDSGLLLIIRHDTKNLSMIKKYFVGTSVQLNSVIVNGIPFYTNNKEIEINKELLDKMILIHNTIDRINKKDFKLLSKTIYTILQSYSNTGIVSKEDLVWLNGIYNKYKKLGDLYE